MTSTETIIAAGAATGGLASAGGGEAESQFYTVKKGDTLSKIAKEFYGEASKFRSLQGKPVLVKGRQYWIQGAAAPVLVPDQVQELSAVE